MVKNKKSNNNIFKYSRAAHGTENTEDYLELIGDMLNKTWKKYN